MANIKSAKKRVLQSAKRQLRNQSRKSSIKTAVKKVVLAIESADTMTKELLIAAESKIARAKGKGVMHRKTAARKISRLAKKVAAASRAA